MGTFKEQIAALAADEPRVDGLVEALEGTEPSVSVRFNRRKIADVPGEVAGEAASRAVPWCERGRYVDRRPVFTFDPLLHQGVYYVQDASSMFIYHVIKSLTAHCDCPQVYLDACAAPGGKTTAAIDALPDGSLVVANEWDYRRAEILRENLMKWGYDAAVVSRGDTKRYRKLKETFDIIAADVPCSGEGMMRKDADAVEQWSEGLVEQCAERQREIVDNLWCALKPGGYMIYSTCTFNRTENEDVVNYIIEEYGAESVEIDTSGFSGIVPGIGTDARCYRFMPHLVEGEGLFLAVLRKPGEPDSAARREKLKEKKPAKFPFKLEAWVPQDCELMLKDDTLWGVRKEWKPLIDKIMSTADVIMPGVEIGTVKGRDLIPSQGLATSVMLDATKVNRVDVDRPTALAYLRRDTISLPDDAPRGHILLYYEGRPLGWVKNLGNRANNLYPAPWRILRRPTDE